MMQEAKYAAILRYLEENFQGHVVEQKHDFSRRAQSFSIYGKDGAFILKVSDELIMDNDVAEIQRLLKVWKVFEALIGTSGSSILLSESGLDRFDKQK